MKIRVIFFLMAWFINLNNAISQIPFEVFIGDQRTTLDVMFFKFFNRNNGEQSRWLFFNRNRTGIDYRITPTSYLPLFGFTEAISYNHKALKGIAPVAVFQVLNRGIAYKAGIQYAHVNKKVTVFTWLVNQLSSKPEIDYFLLMRYSPQITRSIKLFLQAESINTFSTNTLVPNTFTQRLRLGYYLNSLQAGAGIDLNQMGRSKFISTANTGIFLRHEF